MILFLAGCGCRLGSFGRHVTPIDFTPRLRDLQLVDFNDDLLAIVHLYNTKRRRWFYTVLSSECCESWLQYRAEREAYGETLTENSYLFREDYDFTDKERANKPIPVTVHTVENWFNQRWKLMGLEKRQFANIRGFRKFHNVSLKERDARVVRCNLRGSLEPTGRKSNE